MAELVARAAAEISVPTRTDVDDGEVAKAEGVDPEVVAAVRAWLEEHLTPDTDSIDDVLRELYADAGNAGAALAAGQLPPGAAGAPGAGGVDWSTWRPGNPAAAELGELLPQRLSDIEITIQGITDTQVDLLAGRLADGLWAGSNMSTIAASIDEVLGTDDRGMIIARTETCRAVEEASQNAYAANDIAEWEWMIGDEACDDCEPFDGQTFPVGSTDPSIPYHPNCRCSSAPVVDTGATEDDLAEVGED